MIFVTGDCHADYTKFSNNAFPEQKNMTRNDIVIVCGDFGIWHKDAQEKWWHKWLSEKRFTIVFADGNHENFDRLYSEEFPVVDFHGGKAHKITENVYHLMRGYVFDFEGKKFFVFGGAASHDIEGGVLDPDGYSSVKEFKEALHKMQNSNVNFRVNHYSWWKEEMPSEDEMRRGYTELQKVGFKVDYVITHCLPHSIATAYLGGCKPDTCTSYLDGIKDCLTFKKWFCGHYHDNVCIFSDYIILYEQIIQIT